MKKSYKDIMQEIFEEYIFCFEEKENATTEERRKQFDGMCKAYWVLIQMYDEEENFAKYYKKHLNV